MIIHFSCNNMMGKNEFVTFFYFLVSIKLQQFLLAIYQSRICWGKAVNGPYFVMLATKSAKRATAN
jgi:hypothetical protein